MNIDLHYQRQKCSAVTSDSSLWRYKVYRDIHGVPWTGGVKQQKQ